MPLKLLTFPASDDDWERQELKVHLLHWSLAFCRDLKLFRCQGNDHHVKMLLGSSSCLFPYQTPNSHGSWQSQGQCLRS